LNLLVIAVADNAYWPDVVVIVASRKVTRVLSCRNSLFSRTD